MKRQGQRGFTLVELMIVVALMSVLATLAIPYVQPNTTAQLQSAAEVVAADIAFARSMAVSRGSEYTLTFDLANDSYVLTHTGALSALDKLPGSPFHYNDADTERSTRLADLPSWGAHAQIAAVHAQPDAGSPTAVTTLEFDSLGATTRSETTVIWLRIGQGNSFRCISIEVDPVTGLETINEVTNTIPASVASL